ncbi:MAG: carbohydrate binding family 9 domain-containing protein [Acidobacteria bacterium]|nr:carbohydrate binding family 9 domain-containing protein [Acidobacteriota bacterium]
MGAPKQQASAPALPGPTILALTALLAAGASSIAAPQEAAPAAETAESNPFGRKYPPRIYQAAHLQGPPPEIDGRLDDEAWGEGVWSGGYTQQIPTEGAPPSRPTELKILYDDRSVYMAIRVHDDPTKVHRYPGRRDAFTGDIVGICFDSYNDKRTGFEFDLTAGGSKIDLILGNGEVEWDTSWDAVWDGKVAHDEMGWTAEFRVPLSQLRFGPEDEQVWGLHAWRWIDRLQEEDQWQLIPRQNTGRMHQLGELHGIRGLPSPRRLELLPHVLGKTSSGPLVPDSPAASGSMGLDAKLGLSTNFTLDATLNPDFGQVEADPSVVNLTAYETFYEEKRPFFLEGRKILSLGALGSDQLFYSRRIGQAPSHHPPLDDGEALRAPESTTILTALKVTGKTPGGLSVGVLQSFTQKETAEITGALGARDLVVEPFGSYTVGRLRKDWDKGNTSLGGMLTSTHRQISDPSVSFLPTQATTGGLDFTRYFGDRAWVLEASGFFSHVQGDREALRALQTNAVHNYQRPDADHLGVDENATSLFGHGGSVRFGRAEHGRLRVSDQFLWYSPGLDFNDVGYLRQADFMHNEISLGWHEAVPRGIFRSYLLQVSREDQWDFGGLPTLSQTTVDGSGVFANKWQASVYLRYQDVVDTRMLRGGPALRWHDILTAMAFVRSDPSRRVSARVFGEYSPARDDDSYYKEVNGFLNLQLSNRLSLSGSAAYVRLRDHLQYAATAPTDDGSRWVLARIDQDTWDFTIRVNFSLTPDLTVQYYGSPFIGTGRYTEFKRATDTLAQANSDRFHLYGPAEISFRPDANAYDVTESDGGITYSFSNPDFSFRQFRSNLVVRWEWKPGSSLYVVWSQGRTDSVPSWDSSLGSNWDALWRTRPDNVFLVKLSYWFSP